MTLTDLQVELRAIENRISILHNEIERMKPQSENEKVEEYTKITRLAEKYPIKIKGINQARADIKKSMIESMAYVVALSEQDIYVRLLYLCRLSIGCGEEGNAEEIFKSGLTFDDKRLDEICSAEKAVKYEYLIEMLVITNIGKHSSESSQYFVAEVAKILGLDDEEIRVIAIMAKSKLMENPDVVLSIPVPSINKWSGMFSDYLPSQWLISNRKKCGELCVDMNVNLERAIPPFLLKSSTDQVNHGKLVHRYMIKESLDSGAIVSEGEDILTYEVEVENKLDKEKIPPIGSAEFASYLVGMYSAEKTVKKKESYTIKAPCNGVLFLANIERAGKVKGKKDKYLVIYVVSYFDEYNDFCKWLNEQALVSAMHAMTEQVCDADREVDNHEAAFKA